MLLAHVHAACFNRLTKDRRRAFGGRQESDQHLHRRRLAAAVGAEKTKNFAARDRKARRGSTAVKLPEALGQAVRLDGDSSGLSLTGRGGITSST